MTSGFFATDFGILILTLLKSLALIVPLLIGVAYLTYAERKVLAAIQLRRGPNVTGPFGLWQPFADAIKMLFKETIIPDGSNRYLFLFAPVITFGLAIIAWAVMGLLWLLVNRTDIGKRLRATAINPRALTLLGFDLERIYLVAWLIYGLLAGIAGVLIGSFLGSGSGYIAGLTGSAFTIVVLGGLGSVSGTLIAAYIVGYIETLTAYLVSPALREVPALLLLIAVMYVRPQGLLGKR
jgi:branched-chain amino acid transport system permease protein